MLVQGHIDSVVYRLVGSVAKLQEVQEWVSDGFEVGQYKALEGQRDGPKDRSVVLKSCGP